MPERGAWVPPLGYALAGLVGVAALDAAWAQLSGPAVAAFFSPVHGLALALLLLGGLRMAGPVLLGSLLAHWLLGTPVAVALCEALSLTLAASAGAWLLGRSPEFDLNYDSFAACRQLLLLGCGVAGALGALASSTGLLLSGAIAVADWAPRFAQWWMGAALGTLLVSVLVIAGWKLLAERTRWRRLPELVLVLALALAAGQVIFSGWRSDLLGPLANAYWMFLFVTWAGARLGMFSTVGLLCVIALQALWGTYHGTGFFARDAGPGQGFGYWSFMMILSVVGMSLAAHLSERRRQKALLRVAAIAFECQEAMLITDAQSVILQANQSFLHLSGYAAHEVLGKTPHFLLPAAQARSGGPPQAAPDFAPERDVRRREWHQHKSGETYPVWITLGPVKDRQARTTHYVVTMSDITTLMEQEAQRRKMEQAQREALVQEVHHRIKNNLQGIMGMLRTLDHQHPDLHAPITQVIGQIHSISVIHGLQGRANPDRVRLCELTCAVAGGIESLWNTPIAVDIPAPWQACRISPSEAVPVALVLNELIVNAVKHGGQKSQGVCVTLRKGAQPDHICITIANPGQWPATPPPSGGGHSLVSALMPRSGAALTRTQAGERAELRLEFSPPVIHLETETTP